MPPLWEILDVHCLPFFDLHTKGNIERLDNHNIISTYLSASPCPLPNLASSTPPSRLSCNTYYDYLLTKLSSRKIKIYIANHLSTYPFWAHSHDATATVICLSQLTLNYISYDRKIADVIESCE